MPTRLWITIVLTLTTGSFAAPPPSPAPAQKPADKPAAPPKITARPGTITLNARGDFDKGGKPLPPRFESDLSVVFSCPWPFEPQAYDQLRITRMITDNGVDLLAGPPGGGGAPGSFDGKTDVYAANCGDHREFTIQLPMSDPPPSAAAIAEISGTLRVQYTAGQQKQVDLPPLGKILGHRVLILGLNRPAWVAVERTGGQETPRGIRIQMPPDIGRMFDDVDFFDAKGHFIKFHYSGAETGGLVYHDYEVDLPSDGVITLTFWTELHETVVPFTLKNVPLPRPRVLSREAVHVGPVKPVKDDKLHAVIE